MEIRTYLRAILRYWWLVLLLMVAAGVATALLDRVRTPTYSTQARMALRPSTTLSDTRTIVDLVGQMSARNIPGTFAQAATSAQVLTAARQAAGISDADADDYTLEANVLPDTSVVQVTGTGPNPTTLVNYLNASLEATVNDSRALFQVLELVALEPARIPDTPIAPQPSRDIPLGVALGLGLGILLALLIDYARGLMASRHTRQVAPTPATSSLDLGRK
jgi:receptor protein-tyrosine kinase